jgi:hypothetical protein
VDKRARNIRHAEHALGDLVDAANRGFNETNWGDDNGCKALLARVRDDARALIPLLRAASALNLAQELED